MGVWFGGCFCGIERGNIFFTVLEVFLGDFERSFWGRFLDGFGGVFGLILDYFYRLVGIELVFWMEGFSVGWLGYFGYRRFERKIRVFFVFFT